MPTYLIHKPTGDRYLYTKEMADRTDMIVEDEPDIAPAKEETPPPKPKAAKKPAKAKPAPVVTEPVEPEPVATDPTPSGSDDLDAIFGGDSED